jgi:L-alanine-DL-glutamate epimerase-like enolase superfamily enzyme
MATWSKLADLPVEVDSYDLEALQRDVSSDFTRLSTVIHLRGGGEEGVGEDVTYDAEDHVAAQERGPMHDLSGSHTLASFSELIGGLDLFPVEPNRDVSRIYRRWAYESAALDLALRQAGRPLHEVLGREPRPVTFVVSLRLGKPASTEHLTQRLARYPTLRFKLDPTNDWDEKLVAELVATGAVDSVDMKGLYKGTVVDVETDPALYRLVAEAFPHAWIEDPDLTPEVDEVLRPYRDRVTWDANIHGVADIEGLPFPPRMVNIKPSRFGSIEALTAAYDYCDEHGIGAYGGGQFELGPGRGQIQYLASLFHPDTPNDTAPSDYNDVDPPDGLPASPLEPRPSATGFRWDG